MTKHRNNSRNWEGFHKDLAVNHVIYLSLTIGQNNAGGTYFQGGFSASGTNNTTIALSSYLAQTGRPMIGYAFHSVEGYSKVGSYVANANADGSFVYTGFKPILVLLKNINNGAVSWQITDSARSPTNVVNDWIQPNLSDSEDVNVTTLLMDYYSNGFKIRNGTYSETNAASGNTFIYLAFAETPFKYSLAR